MPIDIVPEEYRVLDTDVTEILGIQKWEAPVSPSLGGMVRGNMPGWCKKTDQERCQNLVDEIRAAYDNDVEFEVTIKLDGAPMTVGHNDGDKIVCSRNLSLILDQTGNTFVDVAKSSGILKDIAKLGNICISGELMGPGIQKNREKLSKHEFYVFDMLYVDTYSMVPAETRRALAADLWLRHVPVLHHRITLRELELDSIDKILKFAEGKSLNAEVREGVVFKSIDGTFSFKAISNKFLLKNNE